MSVITVDEVRDYLEGYGIEKSVISDKWIENRRDKHVIPYVENFTRQSFSSVKTAIEYYSGNGSDILILNRKPIVALVSIMYVLGGVSQTFIGINAIETLANEGILKAKAAYDANFNAPLFVKGNRNLKVQYTYGYTDYPDDIREAIIMLIAYQALNFVGTRTGGGQLGVQGISKNYGPRGKYNDLLVQLDRQAHYILKQYSTGLVGN